MNLPGGRVRPVPAAGDPPPPEDPSHDDRDDHGPDHRAGRLTPQRAQPHAEEPPPPRPDRPDARPAHLRPRLPDRLADRHELQAVRPDAAVRRPGPLRRPRQLHGPRHRPLPVDRRRAVDRVLHRHRPGDRRHRRRDGRADERPEHLGPRGAPGRPARRVGDARRRGDDRVDLDRRLAPRPAQLGPRASSASRARRATTGSPNRSRSSSSPR